MIILYFLHDYPQHKNENQTSLEVYIVNGRALYLEIIRYLREQSYPEAKFENPERWR